MCINYLQNSVFPEFSKNHRLETPLDNGIQFVDRAQGGDGVQRAEMGKAEVVQGECVRMMDSEDG